MYKISIKILVNKEYFFTHYYFFYHNRKAIDFAFQEVVQNTKEI